MNKLESILNSSLLLDSCSNLNSTEQKKVDSEGQKEDEEIHSLVVPDISSLPLTPPSAIESNFVTYFAPGN